MRYCTLRSILILNSDHEYMKTVETPRCASSTLTLVCNGDNVLCNMAVDICITLTLVCNGDNVLCNMAVDICILRKVI